MELIFSKWNRLRFANYNERVALIVSLLFAFVPMLVSVSCIARLFAMEEEDLLCLPKRQLLLLVV